MNLKDYIIKDETVLKSKEKANRTYNKPEYNYTLVYENDTDFILNRTTQRTEMELVVLVSQGQCYLKNKKNNELIKVNNTRVLQGFFKDFEIPVFEKINVVAF